MTRRTKTAGRRGVSFLCERCGGEIAAALAGGVGSVACPACGALAALRAIPGERDGALAHCLRCGGADLYVQKDFNKKTGLWIFVVAAVLSVPTWGMSLLAATAVDLILYHALGDATLCYACGAVHRGFARNPGHAAFDLHVQERVDRGYAVAGAGKQ